MTFEGQYLTYAEFQVLGGSAIGLTPFNLLEFEARRKIDIKTFNRIKKLQEIPEEVKLCEFALIKAMSNYDKTLNGNSAGGNVASETIDGYSVSYITSADAGKIVEAKASQINDIIRSYLLNVIIDGQHLMYCGADE